MVLVPRSVVPRVALLSLLLSVFLLCSPTAFGQLQPVVDPEVEIELAETPHGQPVPPSIGGQSIPGTAIVMVKVKCPQPSTFTTSIDIEHDLDTSEEWIFAGLSEPNHGLEFSPPDCVAEETLKEYPVTVDFVFGRDAPAFSTGSITFKATPTNASEPTTTTWTETVGFGGAFDARVVSDFQLVDGKLPIEIEVTNTANGPIDVKVELSITPSQGTIEPASTTLTVPSKATDATNTATFTLLYTPNIKATDQFTLDLSAVSSDDAIQKLRPVVLDVKIDNENGAIYGNSQQAAESAGPGPFVAMLAGLLAAAYCRRR